MTSWSHGSAATSPTAMLVQRKVRLTVPASRIPGEVRAELNQWASMLKSLHRLPDLYIEHYTVKLVTFDLRNEIVNDAADLGEELDRCNVEGYVSRSNPELVNIRAERPLDGEFGQLWILTHEAKHCEHLRKGLFGADDASSDRGEKEVQVWTKAKWPEFRDEMRHRRRRW